jgi:hypothetical protein
MSSRSLGARVFHRLIVFLCILLLRLQYFKNFQNLHVFLFLLSYTHLGHLFAPWETGIAWSPMGQRERLVHVLCNLDRGLVQNFTHGWLLQSGVAWVEAAVSMWFNVKVFIIYWITKVHKTVLLSIHRLFRFHMFQIKILKTCNVTLKLHRIGWHVSSEIVVVCFWFNPTDLTVASLICQIQSLKTIIKWCIEVDFGWALWIINFLGKGLLQNSTLKNGYWRMVSRHPFYFSNRFMSLT